jgi:hypothetical protein
MLNITVKQTGYITTALLIGLMSCKHNPLDTQDIFAPPVVSETCDPDVIYFNEQVLPIFQSTCAVPECHDAETAEEGFVFESYAGIMSSDEITPFEGNSGEIIEKIMDSDPDDIMPPPPQDPLTQSQIQLIVDWIDQGALNLSCPDVVCDTLEVTFSGDIGAIVESRCKGCHNGSNAQAGLTLTNYDEISGIALNGGLMGALTGDGFAQMPPNGALTACQIRMFEMWVENGAPND